MNLVLVTSEITEWEVCKPAGRACRLMTTESQMKLNGPAYEPEAQATAASVSLAERRLSMRGA